jgi:hypothetical protein
MTYSSNPVAGLPPEVIRNMNQHLSSGTVGMFYPGNQLDALINGVSAGFASGGIIADVVAATVGPSRTIPASLIGSLAGVVYHYLGERGAWRVNAGSTEANAVAATTGIYATNANHPKTRGVFRAALGDINAAAYVVVDNGGSWLPVAASQDFEAHFGITSLTNLDQAATVGYAEFGIVEGATAVTPANAIGTYYARFRIAAGRITAGTETTSLNAVVTPTGPFKLTVRYVASQQRFYFEINGEEIGGVAKHASMVGAQCFTRTAHLAAYAAAGDSPISTEVDYIVCNAPILDHQN